MEKLLKSDFLGVINDIRCGDAPLWTATPEVRTEDVDDNTVDVDDPKENDRTIKREFGKGTASYVNGSGDSTFQLRFICYDEYLHQFVFDDGKGHSDKSFFRQHFRMADFVVYDTSDDCKWLVVQELSKGEPIKFQFGSMKRLGFMGYETSKVILD